MNTGRLIRVLAAYKEHLRRAHTNNPGKYQWPVTKIDDIVKRIELAAKEAGSLDNIDIKTSAWKATAKQFGLAANTHKAWRGYFNGRD